jgi:hypothetical protein
VLWLGGCADQRRLALFALHPAARRIGDQHHLVLVASTGMPALCNAMNRLRVPQP